MVSRWFLQILWVTGECCSHSWIEHLEIPNDIRGGVISRVVDGDYVPTSLEEKVEAALVEPEEANYESIAVYQTNFYTNRGTISLEYRNSSNGYYGGSLCDYEP